jgi:hypothetical protein
VGVALGVTGPDVALGVTGPEVALGVTGPEVALGATEPDVVSAVCVGIIGISAGADGAAISGVCVR